MRNACGDYSDKGNGHWSYERGRSAEEEKGTDRESFWASSMEREGRCGRRRGAHPAGTRKVKRWSDVSRGELQRRKRHFCAGTHETAQGKAESLLGLERQS